MIPQTFTGNDDIMSRDQIWRQIFKVTYFPITRQYSPIIGGRVGQKGGGKEKTNIP